MAVDELLPAAHGTTPTYWPVVSPPGASGSDTPAAPDATVSLPVPPFHGPRSSAVAPSWRASGPRARVVVVAPAVTVNRFSPLAVTAPRVSLRSPPAAPVTASRPPLSATGAASGTRVFGPLPVMARVPLLPTVSRLVARVPAAARVRLPGAAAVVRAGAFRMVVGPVYPAADPRVSDAVVPLVPLTTTSPRLPPVSVTPPETVPLPPAYTRSAASTTGLGTAVPSRRVPPRTVRVLVAAPRPPAAFTFSPAVEVDR